MSKKNDPEVLPAEEKKRPADIIIDSGKGKQVVPSSDSKELDFVKLPPADPLTLYLREVSKFNLLTLEEEKQLTNEFKETGDIEVAKKLVQANLRLVVKIAMEYRHAYQNILDLIQEGNIGLMKAVSLYDSGKGAKLSYYASWWIKSYILKFLLDNFRLVKIGTTSEQKKLFYNLTKERQRLEAMGIKADYKTIAENLSVSEKSVALMDKRLNVEGGEMSLDKPLGNDPSTTTTLVDTLALDVPGVDSVLEQAESLKILKDNLGEFLGDLKERDREIFTQRLLTEVPPSLQKIADQYGVSRERIRQIEERLLKSLREYMKDHLET